MKRFLFIILIIIGSLWQISAQQNVQDIIREGVKLHDQEKYREAITLYEKALKLNPQSMSAMYEMAFSYLALKELDNTLKYSTKVINSNNKNLLVKAYCIKSEALAEMGKIDKAITLLQHAIDNNPNDYNLHFNLALNYFKKDDIKRTLSQVQRAIDLNKSHSGAYLLYAYALNDSEKWVKSIMAFQMFLLLEPDSKRSKNAFDEMLQTIGLGTTSELQTTRSFIRQQLKKQNAKTENNATPQLNSVNGLNRAKLYNDITAARDSILKENPDIERYLLFKNITKTFYSNLSEQLKEKSLGTIWTFYIPVFTRITESDYFDTFTRYISVSYFPESLTWWENNKDKAAKFVYWFESGSTK